MRFADFRKLEWVGRQTEHRGGGYVFKNLMHGDPEAIENYWLVVAKGDGTYYSPRHRHNFDQFRFILEGRASLSPRDYMKQGDVGYFPEGARYGPQQETEANMTMLLQFGASVSGYLSAARLMKAQQALLALGTFEGGVFKRATGSGPANQDGFEATWEYATGRKIAYAAPRYETPIVMTPDHFVWREIAGGVSMKTLGIFTERETRVEMVAIESGARCDLQRQSGLAVMFVASGSGTIDGLDYAPWCAAEIGAGEVVRLAARERTELLIMTLPPIPLDPAAAVPGDVAIEVAA